MIVAVCLSKGRSPCPAEGDRQTPELDPNLGAMNVLCTDKTGTLTMDRVILEKHCDVDLKEDEECWSSRTSTAIFRRSEELLDRAILQHSEVHEQAAFRSMPKSTKSPSISREK